MPLYNKSHLFSQEDLFFNFCHFFNIHFILEAQQELFCIYLSIIYLFDCLFVYSLDECLYRIITSDKLCT